MKAKKLLFIAALFSGSLLACDNRNANQNDGTGEMPEDPSAGTGERIMVDTAKVDTLRLDSLK